MKNLKNPSNPTLNFDFGDVFYLDMGNVFEDLGDVSKNLFVASSSMKNMKRVKYSKQ